MRKGRHCCHKIGICFSNKRTTFTHILKWITNFLLPGTKIKADSVPRNRQSKIQLSFKDFWVQQIWLKEVQTGSHVYVNEATPCARIKTKSSDVWVWGQRGLTLCIRCHGTQCCWSSWWRFAAQIKMEDHLERQLVYLIWSCMRLIRIVNWYTYLYVTTCLKRSEHEHKAKAQDDDV